MFPLSCIASLLLWHGIWLLDDCLPPVRKQAPSVGAAPTLLASPAPSQAALSEKNGYVCMTLGLRAFWFCSWIFGVGVVVGGGSGVAAAAVLGLFCKVFSFQCLAVREVSA